MRKRKNEKAKQNNQNLSQLNNANPQNSHYLTDLEFAQDFEECCAEEFGEDFEDKSSRKDFTSETNLEYARDYNKKNLQKK